jgi:hypothetical protein
VLHSVEHCEYRQHETTDERSEKKDLENCHKLGMRLRLET